MQDALPAFVLRPEVVSRNAMNESPSTSPHETVPGPLTDEQLMLEFSKGSAAAFAELFSRYKRPCLGSSAADWPIPVRDGAPPRDLYSDLTG